MDPSIFFLFSLVINVESENYGFEPELFPSYKIDDSSSVTETINFLSATLGDHMVLQRAPQQAIVWGNTTAGATVITTFNGKSFTSTADVNGTWRQVLPATPASKKAYTLRFKSSSGETASLSDVLFGDVYICGGQSNMQFGMLAVTNKSTEIELANNYPTIRLFTVGQKTKSNTPLRDLQTIEQNWSVANNVSIAGGGGFGWFSAVCWFFGRQISDALSPTGDVPIGLISNNWGGTPVESWSTTDAFKACNRSGNGNLYNAMINPYTIGPMAISGFTWYQGEANTGPQPHANQYSCLFPAMITGWRKQFKSPDAYFGFVQLSTWCAGVQDIPEMREAQMAALQLPKVGYSTNADHGAGCNIHPPPKQYCGARLGNSALALHYGKKIAWRSPSYKSASASVSATAVTVIVILNDVSPSGLTTDIYPFNYLDGKFNCTTQDMKTPGTCAWGAIELSGTGWVNASAVASGQKLLLQAAVPSGIDTSTVSVVATAYGWGPIPLMNAYDKDIDLPVLPWNHTL